MAGGLALAVAQCHRATAGTVQSHAARRRAGVGGFGRVRPIMLLPGSPTGRKQWFFTASRDAGRAVGNRDARRVARGGPASPIRRGRRKTQRSPRRAAVGPPATASAPDSHDSRAAEWPSKAYRPQRERAPAVGEKLPGKRCWFHGIGLALIAPTARRGSTAAGPRTPSLRWSQSSARPIARSQWPGPRNAEAETAASRLANEVPGSHSRPRSPG